MVEKEEVSKEKWIVGEVPVKTAPAIVDSENNDVITIEQTLAKILNNQEKILEKL